MSKTVPTTPSHLSFTTPFVPARGLGNPHLQTLWGPLWRKRTLLARTRERMWLKDGDFLDLDWHGPHEADAPLVLVLHGLTGSSNSPYVAGLQKAMATQGWASVALNWRGCSGEPNLLSRSYHSGASEDLAEVIEHLRALRPLAPLYAVGYSLGGNVLLKHLGEVGADSELLGAVAVSVPFRLDESANRMGQGFSRIYQRHFMREMLSYIREKQRRFQHEGLSEGLAELAALGSLENMRTFWEFDGRVTAPLHGYVDAQDYYRRASSRFFLSRIQTPTLIIQAADDPFVFPHSLPEAGELSASTEFELHAKGGHVGFVDGSLKTPGYYLERRIPLWLGIAHERDNPYANDAG
ncbi:hydrolase [Pseudomonas sp. v388]|uniref:hydrolase n=1 Tax=Pseudomonas sp. v388 TaxID=2479849 RepID=UPI000F7B8399|nr:hydrolase [Pseudomonas sp. v388]RRV04931.1 hydrolase [Pseudomonas sp. v388]